MLIPTGELIILRQIIFMIKKGIVLITSILLIIQVSYVKADNQTAVARKELFDLLTQRETVFSQYNERMKKKSGIFGFRTKNDMRESHEKLSEIIEIDNKIINSLNRVIDYRNYEKSTMTYDVSDYLY